MNKGVLKGVAAALLLIIAWRWTAAATGVVTASHEYRISKYYRFESLQDNELVQQFTPQYNRLEAIELFLVNIYPETDGSITLSIADEDGREIFRKAYPASEIPTGEFWTYEIGKRVKPDEQYELRISYDGNSEEIPQVMVSQKNKNLTETETMYVQGNESDYNLAVSYHYRWYSFWGFSY